jgi:HK97 family phage prohead protease
MSSIEYKATALATLKLEQKNIGPKISGVDLQWKVVDEDQGIIQGYVSVFNNIDSQRDRVRPGAFKKTVADGLQRKANKGKKFICPLLWMHEVDKPIGGVIDAVEDKIGLLATAQVDITTNEQGIPRNPLALSVFSGLKMGYSDEFSIGYKAIQKSYDNAGIRDLTEIQLFECSVITELFASNDLAQVTQVKSNDTNEEKDFDSRYADAMARDVLEDWYDLACSLKYALIDAFTQGDEPLKDATIALDQFGPALLAWVQRGIDADLSEYLAAQMQSSGTSSYGYSYASRSDMPDFKFYIDQLQQERKKGAKVSKSTSDQIAAHVDTLDSLAEQHKSMIKSHRLAMKTINSVADDLSAVIGHVAYGENADVAEEGNAARTGKSSREPRADKAALTQEQPDEQPTANYDLAQLQAWLEAKVSSKGK